MKFRKSEDVFDLIGEADEKYLLDARKGRGRSRAYRLRVPIVAAALALLLFVGAFSMRGFGLLPYDTGSYTPPSADPSFPYDATLLEAFGVASAVYPLRAQYPTDDTPHEERDAWYDENRALRQAFWAFDGVPTDFLKQSISQFLSGEETENRVYSPLNVYMALAMTAEITDGESRREILDLLGEETIEGLRETARLIWETHYRDDGAQTCLLASSVWMDDSVSYREDTLGRLAEIYYASAYSGQMGTEDYNEALRAWLNEQTCGLLAEQIGALEMSPETVLALATTVYFNARWEFEFSESSNDEQIFHGENGDVLATFMNRTIYGGSYYDGGGFSAVEMPFGTGGGMYLILPDRMNSVEKLLTSGEALSFIVTGESALTSRQTREIRLSVPKFDVSSKMDLIEGLKELGVESIFDSTTADFSPLTELDGVSMSEVTHGARVTIDEEGCTAAAYTVMLADGSGVHPPLPIEFTVDRPFLFVITSDVGMPIFVGAVNVLE